MFLETSDYKIEYIAITTNCTKNILLLERCFLRSAHVYDIIITLAQKSLEYEIVSDVKLGTKYNPRHYFFYIIVC